jgi:hypothetical protein
MNPSLLIVHNVVDETLHLCMIHRRNIDPPDMSVDTYHWWKAGRQMQIRCIPLCRERQQFGYVNKSALIYEVPEGETPT